MCKENNEFKVSLKYKSGYKLIGRKQNVLINTLIGCNKIEELGTLEEKISTLKRMKDKTDIVTDVSTIKIDSIPLWKRICTETDFIASTVPIYFLENKKEICNNELVEIIHEQLQDGVGIITIHPTATRELIKLSEKRITPCTSRGGNIIINSIKKTGKNNYMEILPDIIKLCRKYNSVISIGTTFRSANIIDSFDEVQKKEIELQIKLADVINNNNVGVIIESPGHATPKKIKEICKLLRKRSYPIMPLGPIPTDLAIGNDHIAAAIGVTLMGLEGCVQIISAVTREEHTGNIPSMNSMKEAIQAAKIAAHIIDINRNGDYSIDRKIASNRVKSCLGKDNEGCSRCGDLCPLI